MAYGPVRRMIPAYTRRLISDLGGASQLCRAAQNQKISIAFMPLAEYIEQNPDYYTAPSAYARRAD